VVFTCGTIVRCQASDEPFVGFDSEDYDFPTHRLNDPDVLDEILLHNEETYKRILNIDTSCPKYKQVMQSAYNLLVKDGYPYPGGEGADRLPIKLSDHTGLVFFPYRSPYVMNIVHSSMMASPPSSLTQGQIVMIGGEGRRNDYMEPKPVAVIDRNLTVYRINADPDL
jgi:hypothetical protein